MSPTDAPPVTHEAGNGSGRYVIDLDDGQQAELTYHRTPGGALSLDHTGVPPAHRGQGLALRLVEFAVADARRKGHRLVPVCSYAAAQFRRHPDWADVLAPGAV